MNHKKNIIVSVLGILFFFASNESYSQTNNEVVPVFILQGTVKLKGKPVNGVILSLNKDGKQVAKIITPRNGLYYFQLNKSDSDPQTEYHLNIEKEGVTAGVLKVNTYIPKEQFTVVPYMFNLDFNLTVPDNSGIIKKRDFGKIRWMSDRNVFDFDKEYDLMVEQEIKKVDSAKNTTEQTQLTKKEEEPKNKIDTLTSGIKENKEGTTLATIQKDSLEKTIAIKESKDVIKHDAEKSRTDKTISPTTIQNGSEKTAKKEESKDITKGGGSDKTNNKQKQNLTNNETIVQKNATRDQNITNTGGTIDNQKKAGLNKNQTSAEKNVVTTLENTEKGRSQAGTNKKEIITQKTSEQAKNKKNETTQAKQEMTNNLAASKANTNVQSKSSADSLSAIDASEKDLFFLTGIPMEQFRRILSSPEANKKSDTFEAADVFFANNERSRLLNAKQRLERKKGENLAKKHETNNTLTSLMDMVEEFDKNNK